MKKLISAVLAAAFSLGMTFTSSAQQVEKITPSGIPYGDIKTSIDSFIKERESGLASCVVSVFDSDGVIFDGYYGHSDIENGVKADAETVYEWGSTSKLLVWTSVMQQYERGNIDLNADIREYLPEGFLTKLQYPEEKITMINLMSHNAGFQESFYENQEAAPDDVYDTLEDAVRACECWQAYHVGEYTAYSNWGTALAAYIVECTSGKDYVTYVHENIFEPLGMTHTCIDPMQRDNEWVAAKRSELKCYSRYDEPQYNEDYGECRYAVQLFPAGAGMGTLGDLSKFGQAFVSDNCPLFEKPGTRELMFSATSYFGDSDAVKNSHGLWAMQRGGVTLGHGGNTGGCTADLEFDPVSGLGVAILTNEPGETAFCGGIPTLLYGSCLDREEYKNAAAADIDLSGMYYSKRAITEGAGKAMSFLGGTFPITRNDDGTYSVNLLGFSFSEGLEFRRVGENCYINLDNGKESFVYIKDGIYEAGYMDYYKSSAGVFPTIICYVFIGFGIACLAVILIKLTALIVRNVRRSDRKYTLAGKQILMQQLIFGASGIIFAMFTMMSGGIYHALVIISGILAALLAVISLANGGVLCYNTFKADIKTQTKVKQIIWVALCIAYTTFILIFQLYNFWSL